MKCSRTLTVLALAAILAPMPAAASNLTADAQRRPARSIVEMRQRMVERRQAVRDQRQRRMESLRSDQAARFQSARLRAELRRTLRALRQRIARHRAIRRGF